MLKKIDLVASYIDEIFFFGTNLESINLEGLTNLDFSLIVIFWIILQIPLLFD